MFAPEILENIEIIYTYPIDGVMRDAVTNLSKIDIDSILIGKIVSDNQLVVERPLSSLVQENSWATLRIARPGANLDIEDRWFIAGDQIQNLPDGYSGENRYWTLKQSWESAMTHSNKRVLAEEYSQIEVNPDTSLMRQGSNSQRKGAGPLLSCLDAESVE